jgi:protein STE50
MSTSTTTTVVGSATDTSKSGAEAGGSSHVRENSVTSTGVSYAVAIYPYMAEQDDEFDVVV